MVIAYYQYATPQRREVRVTPREQVLSIIRERRGYDELLTVPRAFIELTGDTDSALLLSQLLYWTERAANPQGWVYKSRDDWRLELGLNRYRLDRARRRLRELGILEEAHHLVASRRILHLRVRRIELCGILRGFLADSDGPHGPPCLPSAAGTDQDGPSGLPNPSRPTLRLAAFRDVEHEPSERSNCDRSRAETTAETTPETTASSSSTRAKRKGNWRSRENRTGAPDDPGKHPGASPGRHGSLPLREDAASAPGGHGSPPLREDAASAPGGHGSLPAQDDTASAQAEDRLFAILERVSGFPRDRDRAQLRGHLADYPEVDHLLELKKFAAFYEKRTLNRPWFALLNWLDKASMRAAHGPAPIPSAGKPARDGTPHPAPTARQTAEPLPLGLTTAGPAYRKMMQLRQSANPAPP